MKLKNIGSHTLHGLRLGLGALALLQLSVGAPLAYAAQSQTSQLTLTPIKHVIVIIGENRSFDHVFATYVPPRNQQVWNLLSEGIVNSDGSPGPNFNLAEQQAAMDPSTDAFLLNPPKSAFPNGVLPAPLVGGPTSASYIKNNSLTLAQQSENGLPSDYYQFLIAGGAGLTSKTPDTRITDVTSLPPGPFQLTNGNSFVYDSYAASPVHRFYQMWQQLDCSLAHATRERPSGCDSQLFSWAEVTG